MGMEFKDLTEEELCDLMCGKPEDEEEVKSMYECFHCLQRAVVWDSDFDFSDYGYEGEGVIHVCHCSNCGAEIEYKIPADEVTEGEE